METEKKKKANFQKIFKTAYSSKPMIRSIGRKNYKGLVIKMGEVERPKLCYSIEWENYLLADFPPPKKAKWEGCDKNSHFCSALI